MFGFLRDPRDGAGGRGGTATAVVISREFFWTMICATAGLALGMTGCDRPPLSGNGVVAVWGGVGLGPGKFSYPRCLAVSPDGIVYVIDKTARVQRFNAAGDFELMWSMPESQAGKPVGLSVHDDGRVFVADTHYHRVVVFDPDGRELTRFGERGQGDGQFELPTDVAFDRQGRVYVSEYNENDRVTRWSPELKFTDVVVAGEVAGLPLRRPSAILVDAEQTLWVADACNHRVLRFDLDGRLLCGFGEMGAEPGQMRYPYSLDVDGAGRLLVCEYGNCRLQWFDASGRSLAVWGSAGRRIGELNSPWAAASGAGGKVYVVDSLNARIQVLRL